MTTASFTASTQRSRPKVLLVDDEELLLRSILRNLQRKYDVATARGAAEALALLASDDGFDLIISDYTMPGMNGAEFLSAVFEKHPNFAGKMALMSGADLAEQSDSAALAEQGVLMLTKPFDLKALDGLTARS